eukprot:6160974-Amphidinium_carterae.1
MASIAREKIVRPQSNCNWKLHDGYHASGKRSIFAISCKDRAEYYAKNGYTYSQIERELWPSDECWEQFTYGVMLREPLALMKSEMNYRGQLYPEDGGGPSMVRALRTKLAAAHAEVRPRVEAGQ